MRRKLPKHEVGGSNVLADVGPPDAELHLLKAEIVNRIDDILRGARADAGGGRAHHGHRPAGRLEDAARSLPRLQLRTAAGRDDRCPAAAATEAFQGMKWGGCYVLNAGHAPVLKLGDPA